MSSARSSVTKMLEKLEWKTLEDRRRTDRLTMMYKIMNELVAINRDDMITMSTETRTRGSHQFKILKMQGTKDIYMNSFLPRTVTDWNNLHGDIASAATLEIFKNRVQK